MTKWPGMIEYALEDADGVGVFKVTVQIGYAIQFDCDPNGRRFPVAEGWEVVDVLSDARLCVGDHETKIDTPSTVLLPLMQRLAGRSFADIEDKCVEDYRETIKEHLASARAGSSAAA
ncbi:MAG: hypothetical protein QM811_06775 [Pirellulales bacterium]